MNSFQKYWPNILIFLIILGCGDNEKITAFKKVSLVPMTEEKIVENQTVLVKGDRIFKIGPSNKIEIPQSANVIDGAGAYLMPGLADMHVHLKGDWPISQLDLYLANGVTTVRDLDGRDFMLKWRDEIKASKRSGPRLYVSAQTIRGHEKNPPDLVLKHKSGYDCIKLYSYLSDEDYQKVMEIAKKHQFYTIGHIPFAVGLDGVIAAGMDEIAHVEELSFELIDFDRTKNLNPEEWLPDIIHKVIKQHQVSSGFNIKDLTNDQRERLSSIINKLRSANIPVCTTLIVDDVIVQKLFEPDEFLARSENTYLPQKYKRAFLQGKEKHQIQFKGIKELAPFKYGLDKTLLIELHRAGIPLVLGTDAGTGSMGIVPGFSIHDELRILTENGFTPYEAIAAGTKHAADVVATMTGEDDFGSIEVGKRADLILVNKNPLEKVSHIKNYRGVMAGGNWYDKAYLQAIIDPALVPGIPITGVVHQTHDSDGEIRTNLEILVWDSFSADLPDDIDSISITVTDPNGVSKPIELPPYVYYDQHRDFWFELNGPPLPGKYTFAVTSKGLTGKATDFQFMNRKLPIPNVDTFTPVEGEILKDTSPTFSWGPIEYPNTEIYYRLIIESPSRKRVFSTDRVQGMLTYTVPAGILKPGRTYRWRVRAIDSDDWIEIQNRSLSEWQTFTMAGTTEVIPTSARIQNVREPDKSLHTNIDILIGKDFTGNLPGDIDSITITGPKGDLPFSKNDFIYLPQLRDFWISIPGAPETGNYTFTITSGRKSGMATDTIYAVRSMPSPVTGLLSPAEEEIINTKTQTLFWEPVDYPDVPIYYRLEIWNPSMTERVYNTNYFVDIFSHTVPAGILKPGHTYIWRVRVADHRDWHQVQNRANSEWKMITMAENLE